MFSMSTRRALVAIGQFMRRGLTPGLAAVALTLAMAGSALAHNPPGDPLPVNGEPNCFGARVSHSASEHDLTPKAKVELTAYLLSVTPRDTPGFGPWFDYYDANGVSVRTVLQWIRINCSDDPLIANP
jgi:hypothetical protein